MGDKEGLTQRVKNLRINPDALDKVVVPEVGVEVLNVDGKRNSLQIYASITDAEGYISPNDARKGLTVFGKDYETEARTKPGAHPNIDGLIKIIELGKEIRSDVYRRESIKMHPFSDDVLFEAAERFGTPVIVYDEATIRSRMTALNGAFSWASGGFMNHIAVKATDCAPIIQMAYEAGMGVDCASAKELHMVKAMGIPGDRIILTSNATPAKLFKQAADMGAIINFDDPTHIEFFKRKIGNLPEVVYLRYAGDEMVGGNRIIGEPEKRKYGIMIKDMSSALEQLRTGGVSEFGLHQMIVSNELREENLIDSAAHLLDLGHKLSMDSGIKLHGIDFGGGFGHAYRPEHIPLDERKVAEGIRKVFEEKVAEGMSEGVKLKMENGRWLTAESGILLMEALHLEQKPGGKYIKVDASGNDFARVEAYSCYHHLVVLGKSGNDEVYNVAGPKCENSDHWARNRLLPKVEVGNILGLCGAGAHGRMMGPEYNGFLQCGEVMFHTDGTFEMLTRRKSLKDQFAKYDFPGSRFAHLARIEE
ncbi:MAG: DUF2322 family protein [Nanoarchaeota archaeon]